MQLANLLALFGLKDNLPQGQARATFRIETLLASLSSPLTWTANGRITADNLQWAGLSGLAVSSDVTLRDEVLGVTNAEIQLPGPTGQSLALSGELKLRDAFEWQVQLPEQSVQLNASLYQNVLPAALRNDNLPIGNLRLSGASQGTLSPWSAQYALQLANGQLTWLGNSFSNLNASVALSPRGLAIESLVFQAANGSMAGAAMFTSSLDEPLDVTLNYEQIDLAAVRAPVALPVMTGRVSGQAKLSIDKRRMTDWVAMSADVRGSGQAVRIADWGLGNIEYSANKAAKATSVKADVKDAGELRRWQADGLFTSQADNKWQYEIDARGRALDLSIPQLIRLIGTDAQLPVPLEIVLATGNITLRGDTTSGIAATEFNFSNITTLERDRRVWSQGSMIGRTTKEYVELQQSQWQIAGSEVKAALKWHYLANDQPANAEQQALEDYLRLQVDDLQIDTLDAWHIVSLPRDQGRRIVSGMLSGQVDFKRPAGAVSWLTNWQGDVNLRLEDLQIHNQPSGVVNLAGKLSPDQWQGQIEGELLQAPIDGAITVGLQSQPSLSVSSAQGNLNWLGAEVSQLMGLWQGREQVNHWRGVSNLRIEFDWKRIRSTKRPG